MCVFMCVSMFVYECVCVCIVCVWGGEVWHLITVLYCVNDVSNHTVVPLYVDRCLVAVRGTCYE